MQEGRQRQRTPRRLFDAEVRAGASGSGGIDGWRAVVGIHHIIEESH